MNQWPPHAHHSPETPPLPKHLHSCPLTRRGVQPWEGAMCVRRLWVLPEPSFQRNQLEDLGDLRVPCSDAGGPSFLPKEGLFLCPAPSNPHLPERGTWFLLSESSKPPGDKPGLWSPDEQAPLRAWSIRRSRSHLRGSVHSA